MLTTRGEDDEDDNNRLTDALDGPPHTCARSDRSGVPINLLVVIFDSIFYLPNLYLIVLAFLMTKELCVL